MASIPTLSVKVFLLYLLQNSADPEKLCKVLDAGADVNNQLDSRTALMVENAKLLVGNGADALHYYCL